MIEKEQKQIFVQNKEQEQTPKKRQRPTNQQAEKNSKPKKARKIVYSNPFEELLYIDSNQKKAGADQQWIKPKQSPLTIQISDHSKVNKYFSHKSLQKYFRYLFAQSCPNPMWLSIKRQSQIKHSIFIDIQCENSLFHRHLQKDTEDSSFQFLRQFVCPQRKAIFRESPFLKQSKQLWEALFVYDELAVKEDALCLEDDSFKKQLSVHLTPQLYAKYRTYTLNSQQRSNNLYPAKHLPAYKNYLILDSNSETDLGGISQDNNIDNKILVIDCQMVMSANGFELARTSIMNFAGQLIYDQLFKPDEQITNYNTQFSGITEEILKNVTKTIKDLHQDLKKIVQPSTILIGHSLQNDLHAMKFLHENVIDTSVLFARKNGSKMKLKTLSQQILNRTIQQGSHCSEEDCKATLQLVRYKIEIQELQNQNKISQFHLLKELISMGKQTVIVDSNLQFMIHNSLYERVKFCQTTDNSPKTVIKPLGILFDQEKSGMKRDIGFTRIRRQSQSQQWEDYYRQIDQELRSLYNDMPVQTVIFANFQINHSHVVYPQDPQTEKQRKRALCIIIIKSSL